MTLVEVSSDILSLVAAFVAGLLALFVLYRVYEYLTAVRGDSGASARIAYYEKELIDLKLRIDSLQIGDVPVDEPVIKAAPIKQETRPSRTSSGDIVIDVLRLVSDVARPSRDIQSAIGKTREHTSRLMKRLTQEGLVERSADTKPYTYLITAKGRARLNQAK